jgi:hypothetical protein
MLGIGRMTLEIFNLIYTLGIEPLDQFRNYWHIKSD